MKADSRRSSMGKRRRVGGAEMDAFSIVWRNLLKWKRGERAKLKRAARRRERRQARQQGYED